MEGIHPDEDTVSNIRVMVDRRLEFFHRYGPVVKEGFTFKGGYSSFIDSGEGDFLTDDTLWDFKVSKSAPKKEHTLQLLVYYLMGIRSNHSEFKQVENFGIYNPRLNRVYFLPISNIEDGVVEEVERGVIGYG